MTGRVCTKCLSFTLLLLLSVAFGYGLDIEYGIEGSFWVELDPVVHADQEYPLSLETASRRALEEARYVFSAMIYGFTFAYTPYDAARQVDEMYVLQLHAEIPWGDSGLSVAETRVDGNYFRVLIRYDPAEYQVRWIRMMGSNIYHNVPGRGTGNLFKGPEQKLAAINEAIKDGIRNYLRPRILNKPKEVRGNAVLDRVPYIVIDEGQYVVSAHIKIDIDEIIPYRVY